MKAAAIALLAGGLIFGCGGDDNHGISGEGGGVKGGNEDGGGGDVSGGPLLGSDDAVPAGAIRISSFADLCKIGKETAYPLNGTYVLTRNIDASASRGLNGGKGFEPIGMDNGKKFRGGFYGKGYTISGLYINRPDEGHVGLFGYVDGTISGVHLVNVSVTGIGNVGGLVGESWGNILKSSVSGGTVNSVNGEINNTVGGLVGHNYGVIMDCYSATTVNGDGGSTVGGLVGITVGYNSISTIISRSYSVGAVNGTMGGGLVGTLFGGVIDNCYSASAVSGVLLAGGLVGWSFNLVSTNNITITNSYATGPVSATGAGYSETYIGGLVGYFPVDTDTSSTYTNSMTITSCYWDIQSTGIDTSAGTGAVGKTTAQMKQQSTYADWDFSSVWAIDGGYPYLRALGKAASNPLGKAAARR